MSSNRKAIDETRKTGDAWEETYRRLEAARLALEQGRELSREAARRTLRDRARALAREPERDRAPDLLLQVVEFRLAHERYAVESAYVREVFPLKDLTPLPCTPAFVRGIVNVRGQIVSVMDLKQFFDLPYEGITDRSKVIIARTLEMEVGILADAVIGVRSIPVSAIQPSLPTLTGIRAEYLKGVADGHLVVLDVAKILADRRIVVHDECEE